MSPEEAKKRKDWNKSMVQKKAPKEGCFTASYPDTEWKESTCVVPPNVPLIPQQGARPFVVGNGDDISAGAPAGSFIQQAIGHFENITNVTSESGPIGNSGPAVANAYTLQINTNPFASTACAGSPNPNCQGWEQFVYWNDNSPNGVAFIQYWLLNYNATCPAGQSWNQISLFGSTDVWCWKNAPQGVALPNQPITNLGNLLFSGAVTPTSDSVSVSDGTNAGTRNGVNAVNAAAGWTTAEFNIFGAGGNASGGGMASFNAGASMNARTEIWRGSSRA